MGPRGAIVRATERSQWPRMAAGRYPGLPYVVLAVVLLVSSAISVLFTLLPAERSANAYEVGAALLFLVIAATVWFLGPRVPNDWGLDIGVALSGIVVVGAAAVAISPQAQVLVGLTLMLYGVFAAYFRPLARAAGLLALILIAYGLALVLNPMLNVVYFAVIALLTVAVSGVVGVLVTELRKQAVTDQLTGVLNRHGLLVMGSYVQAELTRGRAQVSVALIDIDGFKKYNDEHGHLAGDRALRHVAEQLQDGLRGSDVIARFGGDEFVILLRGVGPVEAEVVLLRVAESVTDVHWSAGVALWRPGQTLDDALADADRQLYAAKDSR